MPTPTPNRYTIDDILVLEPCWGNENDEDYSDELARENILKVWPSGRETVEARDIADATQIDFDDRVWLLTQLLPVPQLRLFLCWKAERLLATLPEDERDVRVVEAIAVVRRYVEGTATDDDLGTVQSSVMSIERVLGASLVVREARKAISAAVADVTDEPSDELAYKAAHRVVDEIDISELVRLHESWALTSSTIEMHEIIPSACSAAL